MNTILNISLSKMVGTRSFIPKFQFGNEGQSQSNSQIPIWELGDEERIWKLGTGRRIWKLGKNRNSMKTGLIPKSEFGNEVKNQSNSQIPIWELGDEERIWKLGTERKIWKLVKTIPRTFILLAALLLFAAASAYSQTTDWSEPVNLTALNSESDDFAPRWNPYENLLYFNSTRSGASKFYLSGRTDSIFQAPYLAKGGINEGAGNRSYIAFESKTKAYISAFRLYERRSYLNIFETQKKKDLWIEPYPVESLSFSEFAAHPTVSPDGSVMIFSSVMKSRFRDCDLWMSVKKDNGDWETPIRITPLQTPGNEITPYLSHKDTLFFASDGQEGPGGYDLFYSVRDAGVWQKPFPLENLNTIYDESDFAVIGSGEAIFASNRPGGAGGLDLYLTRKVAKERKSTIEIPELEASLAAQTTAVKVKIDVARYRKFPLPPCIILERKQLENWDFPADAPAFVASSLDSVYKYSLAIAAERVKNAPDAELRITAYSNSVGEKRLTSGISQILKEKYGLSEDKFALTTSEIPEYYLSGGDILLHFDSNEKSVFRSIETGDYKVELKPPVLDLTLDARPRKLAARWSCALFIGGEFIDSIGAGERLPAKFYGELKPRAEKLVNADSITAKANFIDTLGRRYDFSQSWGVSHIYARDERFVEYGGESYSAHDFIIAFPGKLEAGSVAYAEAIREIAESAEPDAKIIIQYFDDRDITKRAAQALSDKIKAELSEASEIVVRYEAAPPNGTPDKLAPFLVRALVGR